MRFIDVIFVVLLLLVVFVLIYWLLSERRIADSYDPKILKLFPIEFIHNGGDYYSYKLLNKKTLYYDAMRRRFWIPGRYGTKFEIVYFTPEEALKMVSKDVKMSNFQ